MSYLADDSAAIRARLEELEAEKKIAMTGSSASVGGELSGETFTVVQVTTAPDWADVYGYGPIGYTGVADPRPESTPYDSLFKTWKLGEARVWRLGE